MRSLSNTPTNPKPPPSSRPASRQSTLTSASNPDAKGLNSRKKPPIPILSTLTPTGPRTTRITATTTSTTPRTGTGAAPARPSSRSATPAFRQALRPRDQNVAPTATRSMRTNQNPKPPPSTTLNKMPFERASANNNNANRQPPLPTVARGVGKQPLTPKVATTRSSTPQHQTVTVSTPLPRRATRPESALSGYGGIQKDRDDVASPMAAFMNNNITPRSGSRQSRVDSANSTPNGTPQPDRQDAWDTKSGLGILAPGGDAQRPSVTFAQPEGGNGLRASVESKFFYASEAPRPAPQVAQAPRPFVAAPLQKQSSFFYANGNSVPESRPNAAPVTLAPVMAARVSQDNLRSKFVYADGTSDVRPLNRPVFSPPTGPGSTVSTSSKMVTSRPGTGISSTGYVAQRPPSPIKMPSYPPLMNGSNHTFDPLRSPTVASQSSIPDLRRTSGDSAPRFTRGGHSRTGSVTSSLTMAEPPVVARLMSAHNSHPTSETSSPSTFSNPGFTLFTGNSATSGFASLLQAADDFAGDEDEEDEEEEEEDENEDDDHLEDPEGSQSPNKSSQDNQLNELVVSARRERKVQDLQITNASLEAINRTLERQLRKQTAELRRYRRLSRSGRISLGSPGKRDRVTSESSVDGGGLARAGMDLDDLSEEESDFDDDEDEDDYSDSDSGSGSGGLSPNAMAVRDARHRKKDEQRLRLDLSKHQQLLIDSQKMNQSLKRCLGWTEELIKEGKRALEYQVRVSEVNIGGRVLAPEDLEAHDDVSEVAEDESILEPKPRSEGVVKTDGDDQGKDPQDRDSGIELPADGG